MRKRLVFLVLVFALLLSLLAGCGNSGNSSVNAAPYVKRDSFTEKAVTVGTGEWKLPGTVSMPNGKGPFPGLVLVHGSGPHDRDETIGPNKPFRDLAWGIASQGIAVVRYEKRTKQYQNKIVSTLLNTITVKEETTDDAIAAAALLEKTNGVDPKKVFLLGHSLGGTLVPRIAVQDPSIRGFVILAGATTPLEDALVRQNEYLYSLKGAASGITSAQIETIKEQVARVKDPGLSKDTPAYLLPLGVPASYWLDLRGYDPAQTAKSIKRPILILQGKRDFQVTMNDFSGWKKTLSSKKNVTFKIYPSLNHLFISGKGKPSTDEYSTAGFVSGQVVSDISGFVKSH